MTFTPPHETVGERVRRQRKKLGMEQRELAEKAGIGSATIARIEGGADPREETLLRIATALKAPAEWLRTGRA